MQVIKSRVLWEKDHEFRVVVNLYDNGSIRIENEVYDDGTFMPEPGWFVTEDVFIPVEKIQTFYFIIKEFVEDIFGKL